MEKLCHLLNRTDRTILDIDKLQKYDEIGYKNLTNAQKAKWMLGMKGALNASDLNRIGSNQQYILNLLSAQYALTFKTNWLMTNFVKDSDENRILSNLKTLMQPFDFDAQMVAPDKPLNYFEKINQIENIILQMYDKYNERGELVVYDTHDIHSNYQKEYDHLETFHHLSILKLYFLINLNSIFFS